MQFYLERANRPEIVVSVVQQDTRRNRERFFADKVKKPYWALTVPVQLVTDPKEIGSGNIWICDDREDAANIGVPGKPLQKVFSDAGYTLGPELSTPLVNRRWNRRMVGVFPITAPASDVHPPHPR
jgi:hypothetical protein